MADFIAYLPAVAITISGETSFAIVKDNEKYALYLGKDGKNKWFVYYPDNPKISKFKAFKKDDYLFAKIKCSFENIRFTDKILPENEHVFHGVFYSNHNGKNYILKENQCLNYLFSYVTSYNQEFVK